ncbi:MAG: hypothetical protein ACK5AZ_18250 [Bryobacteraceae bacterium]
MKRYTFGPTIEAGLPFSFRLEVDALYKRIRFDLTAGPAPSAVIVQSGSRAHVWEFPLLLKRQVSPRRWGIYAVAGATLRRIGDFQVDQLSIPTLPGYESTRKNFRRPSNTGIRSGVIVGAGISKGFSKVRIEPELRYTHWTSNHYLATTHQVEVLAGIRFPHRASGRH